MYVGLDVHKNVCYGTVMDEKGKHIPSLLVGAVDADPGGDNLFSPPLACLAALVPWFVLGDDARIIASFIQLHHPLHGDDVLDVVTEVIDILHFVSLRRPNLSIRLLAPTPPSKGLISPKPSDRKTLP